MTKKPRRNLYQVQERGGEEGVDTLIKASIAKHISEEENLCDNRLQWFTLSRLLSSDLYIANVYASNKMHKHIEMWEVI